MKHPKLKMLGGGGHLWKDSIYECKLSDTSFKSVMFPNYFLEKRFQLMPGVQQHFNYIGNSRI